MSITKNVFSDGEFSVQLARAERPDALVLLALRVLPVFPASPVPKASRVIPAGRDLAGPPATPSRAPLAPWVPWDRWDRWDRPVCLARREQTGLWVQLAHRAPRELRARRVCPEAWDLEAHQAPLAPQEPTE